MRRLSFVTAVLAAGFALPVMAEEMDVSIDRNGVPMAATLETPEGGPAPVVLMLHGFGSGRDELAIAGTEEGVFERTARHLAESGIASLRIDFVGSGESGGAWAETTFEGQIADALAALDWLAKHEAVDGTKIAVLGWSQGGLVATHVAAARPDLASVVLWAPVVNPSLTYGTLLGADTLAEAMTLSPETPITRTLPWGVDMTLNAAFFQQIPTTSPAGAIAHYPGPLQVIVGAADDLVFPQPAAGQSLLNYHTGEHNLAVVESGHVWGAFGGPDLIDSQMIPITLGWLTAHF